MKERVAPSPGGRRKACGSGRFTPSASDPAARQRPRRAFRRGFQIYDTADQLGCRARRPEGPRDRRERADARRGRARGSAHAKNKLLRPDELARRAVAARRPGPWRAATRSTRSACARRAALDFDDLLARNARDLLDAHPDVAERYARGCRYLLVDEYQDTNQAQYRLVRALWPRTGTSAASAIPTSRSTGCGAPTQQHPRLRERLSRTRSSSSWSRTTARRGVVLRAAAARDREEQPHATRRRSGPRTSRARPIHYHRSRDDRDEAEAVARILASLSESFPTGEIAVLYRTNYQSRLIEDALVRAGIRYRIVGFAAVLRAQGDQGPAGVPAAAPRPGRRPVVPASGEYAGARDRQDDARSDRRLAASSGASRCTGAAAHAALAEEGLLRRRAAAASLRTGSSTSLDGLRGRRRGGRAGTPRTAGAGARADESAAEAREPRRPRRSSRS